MEEGRVTKGWEDGEDAARDQEGAELCGHSALAPDSRKVTLAPPRDVYPEVPMQSNINAEQAESSLGHNLADELGDDDEAADAHGPRLRGAEETTAIAAEDMVPERQAAATAAWKAADEAEVAKLEAEVGSELETGATGMSTDSREISQSGHSTVAMV